MRLAQRVPVSVHIDEIPPSVILAAGTTATVEIDDRTRARIGALHPGGVDNGLSSVFAGSALNDSSTEAERNFAARTSRAAASRRVAVHVFQPAVRECEDGPHVQSFADDLHIGTGFAVAGPWGDPDSTVSRPGPKSRQRLARPAGSFE